MSKFLFMAMPSTAVCQALKLALAPLLSDFGTLFPKSNWHQSLSEPHFGEEALKQQLLRAGDRIRADAFALTFDRIRSSGSGEHIHWLLESGSPPREFKSLLAALSDALHAEGVADTAGHTAHITLAYKAGAALATRTFEPVHWLIAEFVLVEGKTVDGRYCYEVLKHWPMLPCSSPPPKQMSFL